MKVRDIEVGKEYAYSRVRDGSWAVKVKVLEVGVHYLVRDADGWHTYQSAKPLGVRVEMVENGRTVEKALPASRLTQPWSDFLAEREAREERQRSDAERVAATLRRGKALEEKMAELGVTVTYSNYPPSFTVSLEQMETLRLRLTT